MTWLVVNSGLDLSAEAAIAELLSLAKIAIIPADSPENVTIVKINGQDVTLEIRSPAITAQVSRIAAQKAVRQQLVTVSRQARELSDLEGQVKVLTLFPLLRLAGFYRYPIKIRVEEGIDNIILVDEDKTISGRFDIVTVNNSIATVNDIPFWILVISK